MPKFNPADTLNIDPLKCLQARMPAEVQDDFVVQLLNTKMAKIGPIEHAIQQNKRFKSAKSGCSGC